MSNILCKMLCPIILALAVLFNSFGNFVGIGDIIPTEDCPFGGDCCNTTATETTSSGCNCNCGCHNTTIGTDISTIPNTNNSDPNNGGPTQPAGADEDPMAAINVKQLITSQEFAGYRWNPDGQCYCADDKACWRENANYNTVYDQMTPLTAMFIDCLRVRFNYGGKDWMVQFWKGQYGWLLLGAEIGLFTAGEGTTESITELSSTPATESSAEEITNETAIESVTAVTGTEPTNQGTLSADLSNYYCVAEEDWLYIQLDCYYAEGGEGEYEKIFSRPYDKYWWATGFVKGQITKYTAPRSELKVKARITLKDEAMADAFVDALEQAGFTRGASNVTSQMRDDTYYREGADVWILWSNLYQSAF